jgi:hypothetical protein
MELLLYKQPFGGLLVGYMLEEKMTTAVKEGGGPGEGD